MIITEITNKTITIEGEPGDRIGGIDRNGFCYDCVTALCNPDLIADTRRLLREIREARKSDNNDQMEMLMDERDTIIDIILAQPYSDTKTVWVGYNY